MLKEGSTLTVEEELLYYIKQSLNTVEKHLDLGLLPVVYSKLLKDVKYY